MDGRQENLLKKHLSTWANPDAEVAHFLSLPVSKQDVVLERLKVIDDYLALRFPRAADVAASASKLGMSTRNFYRLLAKLRERGPVRGLAPALRTAVRRSAASAGLDPVPETALFELFARKPEVRWNEALRVVEQASKSAGVAPPSQAATRRRLLGLRAAGTAGQAAPFVFGRSWVIDQSALDLPIQFSGRPRYLVVTFIVDRTTRLILGAGLADSAAMSPMQGLALAMRAMMSTIGDFATLPMKISSRLENVHWTIPPEMEGFRGLEGPLKNWIEKSGVAPTWMGRGDYRHGDVLLRLIGDRLGPYRLLPRSTVDPSIAGETERRPLSAQEADIAVREAVLSWNRSLAEKLEGAPPSWRSYQARRRCLLDLAALLVTLFSEILEPDMFGDLVDFCHSLQEQY